MPLISLSDEDQAMLLTSAYWYRQKLLNDIASIDRVIAMLRQEEEHVQPKPKHDKKIIVESLRGKMISALNDLLEHGKIPTSGDIATIILEKEPNPDDRPMWSRRYDIIDKIKNIAVKDPATFTVDRTNPRRFFYGLVIRAKTESTNGS